jgi:hypothetical protein
MVPEAKLKKTEHGLVPNGDGWYVIKVRDVVGFTVDEVAKRKRCELRRYHAIAGVTAAPIVMQRWIDFIRRFARDQGWRGARPLCGAPPPGDWLGRTRSR